MRITRTGLNGHGITGLGNKIIQSAAVVFLLMILLCDHIPVSDVDFVNREITLPDGRSLSLSDRRVRLSGKDGEPVWESEGGYKVPLATGL